ncbi:MAG: hypothetical protein AAFR61_12715 [Bacteroidota bacterium]
MHTLLKKWIIRFLEEAHLPIPDQLDDQIKTILQEEVSYADMQALISLIGVVDYYHDRYKDFFSEELGATPFELKLMNVCRFHFLSGFTSLTWVMQQPVYRLHAYAAMLEDELKEGQVDHAKLQAFFEQVHAMKDHFRQEVSYNIRFVIQNGQEVIDPEIAANIKHAAQSFIKHFPDEQ